MELEKFQDLPDVPDEEDEVQQKLRPILEDIRSMRKYPIPNYPMFIGRDKKVAVCIPVPAVSRSHAKIFEQNGIFYIQDMGSINGTYLNDKRILDPVELKDGDRIKVGVTKQFPRGAREFLFNAPVQGEMAEQDSLFKEIGINRATPSDDRKYVLLRHCVFNVAKRDIVSVLKADGARRVALTSLNLGHRILYFQSLVPFKLKENLVFSIEHPRLSESLKLYLKVTKVDAVEMKVHEHQTEVVKFSEKHNKIFEALIKQSSFVCYITSQLKE